MSIDQYIEEYYANNAKKLHNAVDSIIKNFGGINDKDNFYSLANEVFVRDILQNYDGVSNFDTFVYSCLKKKILTEITRINRDRRTPYLRDKDGNKIKNKDGEFVRMPVLSLDTPIDDDDGEEITFIDTIKSDYDLEQDVMGDDDDGDSKVEKYLNRLSKKQRRIVEMLMEGYEPDEIKKELNIKKREYDDCMENIRSYKNISIFFGR